MKVLSIVSFEAGVGKTMRCEAAGQPKSEPRWMTRGRRVSIW